MPPLFGKVPGPQIMSLPKSGGLMMGPPPAHKSEKNINLKRNSADT